MNIGPRVGRAIERAGLTQRVVAKRAKMGEAALSQIINESTKNPKFSTIEKIVKAIGISFGAFFDEPRIALSSEDAELGQRFRELLGRLLANDAAQKVVYSDTRGGILRDSARPLRSEVEPITETIPDKYVRARANRVYEVQTDAMIGIGILEGAVIYARAAIDRSAADGEIVVCKLNGLLYLKSLDLRSGRTALHSENRKYEDILVDDEVDTFSIVAVVCWP